MAKHTTRKRTTAGKAETLRRKRERQAKYMQLPTTYTERQANR